MLVKSVIIQLEGGYTIERLAGLGFTQNGNSWEFDGKLHTYIFTPTAKRLLTITIGPRALDWRTDHAWGTPHEITFPQVKDWVGKCVGVLEGKDAKPKHD